MLGDCVYCGSANRILCHIAAIWNIHMFKHSVITPFKEGGRCCRNFSLTQEPFFSFLAQIIHHHQAIFCTFFSSVSLRSTTDFFLSPLGILQLHALCNTMLTHQMFNYLLLKVKLEIGTYT